MTVFNPKEPQQSRQMKDVPLRGIEKSKEAEIGLLPFPPPVECEWKFIAKNFGLILHSDLCEEIECQWAKRFGIFPSSHSAEASVVALWVLSRQRGMALYRLLRKTA